MLHEAPRDESPLHEGGGGGSLRDDARMTGDAPSTMSGGGVRHGTVHKDGLCYMKEGWSD